MTSDNTRIVKDAFLIAFFVLLSKSVAALKEITIAWKYGVSEVIDAYQIAITYVLWIPNMISSAIMVVLVPVIISAMSNKKELSTYLSELRGAILLLGLVIGVGGGLLTPILLPMIASALDIDKPYLIKVFSLGLILPSILTLFIALKSAQLMARQKHWNTLFEAVPAFFIVVFVVFWPSEELVAPLIVGTVLGYFFQYILLLYSIKRYKYDGFKICLSFRSHIWASSRKYVGLILIAQFFMSWVTPIDMSTIANLGDGAVSIFSYSERLVSLFLGISAVAISRSILPVLSTLSSSGDFQKVKDITNKWNFWMLLAGILIGAIGYFISPYLVKLIYERGAFDSNDTAAVVEVFQYSLLRLPFYFCGLVSFQMLASRGFFSVVVLINLSCALTKYFLNEYFVNSYGLSGVNVATALMYAWTALCLYLAGMWLFRRRVES